MARFIIVGIDDPYGEEPLEPTIPRSTGNRLWTMTELSLENYRRLFTRYNLFRGDEPQNPRTAKLKVDSLMDYLRRDLDEDERKFVICLGRLVAQGFRMERARPLVLRELGDNFYAAMLPHPSGLNRWYNEGSNRRRAAEFMSTLGAAAKSGRLECPSCKEIELDLQGIGEVDDNWSHRFFSEYECNHCGQVIIL